MPRSTAITQPSAPLRVPETPVHPLEARLVAYGRTIGWKGTPAELLEQLIGRVRWATQPIYRR